jgi:hypothetical protein
LKTERRVNTANAYVGEYLKKDCSSELQNLASTLNNPAKEISESMAAISHLRRFINPGGNMNYVVIGDGSRCLTGAFLAYLTKGNVWSIDPVINMRIVQSWMTANNVLRFKPVKKKFQDVRIEGMDNNPVTLALVHAHVSTVQALQKFSNWRFAYINPCCHPETQILTASYQDKFGIQCVYAGIDDKIISEKNRVFVYHNNSKFPQDRLQAR